MAEDESEHPQEEPGDLQTRGKASRIQFSLGIRLLLFAAGWALLLVGIAGLVLPGLQGVLTILLGAAVLSVVSEWFYERSRQLLGRWPRLLETLESFREKVRNRFGRSE